MAKNLPQLSKRVNIPEYDRKNLKTGIVHIGVGNFHRSHEAFYTDKVLQINGPDWGICGIGLLERDQRMIDILRRQDGLYTLITRGPGKHSGARIIGSIVEYLYAPANQEAVIEKMASPDVRIISMTITEGGYNYDPDTEDFRFSEPLIQWDLEHPDQPRTVFGYLTQALKSRADYGMPGLTILSCDNIQKNGLVCKTMLSKYMKIADPELLAWMRLHCTFPNSMVDRITPATTSYDIEQLDRIYGIKDEWPVPCESFIQWVVEDQFKNGRPCWEDAGVQFVNDVEPYERMKIRLLNAGHSLLGFAGSLLGYQTIDETIHDPLLENYLRLFMNSDVTPVLGRIEGVDLDEYKNNLIQRFGNPNIKDKLSRICAESSDKIPKFLLPTLREQLKRGGSIKYSVLVIACWCRYLELTGTPDFDYEIQDPMKDELILAAKASVNEEDAHAFLKIKTIFGDLIHSERFVELYLTLIRELRNSGIEITIKNLKHNLL
jgi:mannitol 2-dehydrogenase